MLEMRKPNIIQPAVVVAQFCWIGAKLKQWSKWRNPLVVRTPGNCFPDLQIQIKVSSRQLWMQPRTTRSASSRGWGSFFYPLAKPTKYIRGEKNFHPPLNWIFTVVVSSLEPAVTFLWWQLRSNHIQIRVPSVAKKTNRCDLVSRQVSITSRFQEQEWSNISVRLATFQTFGHLGNLTAILGKLRYILLKGYLMLRHILLRMTYFTQWFILTSAIQDVHSLNRGLLLS